MESGCRAKLRDQTERTRGLGIFQVFYCSCTAWSWRWRKYVPPKWRYPFTSRHLNLHFKSHSPEQITAERTACLCCKNWSTRKKITYQDSSLQAVTLCRLATFGTACLSIVRGIFDYLYTSWHTDISDKTVMFICTTQRIFCLTEHTHLLSWQLANQQAQQLISLQRLRMTFGKDTAGTGAIKLVGLHPKDTAGEGASWKDATLRSWRKTFTEIISQITTANLRTDSS